MDAKKKKILGKVCHEGKAAFVSNFVCFVRNRFCLLFARLQNVLIITRSSSLASISFGSISFQVDNVPREQCDQIGEFIGL